MKDEELLKFRRILLEEIGRRRGSVYPANVETAAYVREGFSKRNKKKTDIFLASLSETELNELREALAMGSYFDTNSQRGMIKRIATFPFNDPEKRNRILGFTRLNSDASIADIRRRSPVELICYIDSYFEINCKRGLRKNLIRMIRTGQDNKAAVKRITGH